MAQMNPSIHDPAATVVGGQNATGADLRLLLRLRAIAIVGQTFALAASILLFDNVVPILPVAAGIALLGALNFYSWLRLRRNRSLGIRPKAYLDDRAFFFQILADIAILAYLLHFTGGPLNPFHDMFLLPMAIAAAALPWRYVVGVLGATVTAYTFVTLNHVPFATPMLVSKLHEMMLLGEWINHILLAALVTYFIVRIASGLRAREQLLEEARAKELRNACAVAVGSVAAGVAHELGTPLSTIQVVLGEMRHEHKGDPAISQNLDVMAGQLGACRNILGGLRSFVQSLKQADAPVPVDALIDEVSNRFLDIRPGINFSKTTHGPRPAPELVPDLALQQAIINLLNNAGDVSPGDVVLETEWNEAEINIRVRDRGPGISPELADHLGKVLVSTKPPEAGNGLGLFLTNVTMHRLGGRLRLFNNEDGGACAELSLPLITPSLAVTPT
jgi:two-component system sensor histidine kinase RegB